MLEILSGRCMRRVLLCDGRNIYSEYKRYDNLYLIIWK